MMTQLPVTADDNPDPTVADAAVTGEDRTPYAQELETGRARRWRMVRWVIRARQERICHLGLMRPSRASGRFARRNILLLAIAVGLAVFANCGWHVVERGPGIDAGRDHPTGRSWARVAEFQSDPARYHRDVQPISLWWNPPWATTGAAVCFLVAWITLAVMVAGIGLGARRAAGGPAGGCRLHCAVQYSTAWMALLGVAAVLFVLRPLSYLRPWIGSPAWSKPRVVDTAAVLACAAVVMLWWFWLLRSAAAAPPARRHRARRFFMLTAPVGAVIWLVTVVVVVRWSLPILQTSLEMRW